ncbi:DUF3180 family protein [Propionibacteriaceae bacterium G1746]
MSRVFDDDPDDPGPGVPRPPEGPGHERLKPAGVGLVVVSLLVGMLGGAAVASLFELVEVPLPVTPWTMSGMLVVLGGAAALGSVWLSRRLADPRRRPDFEVPVAALVVGRAGLVTGLLLAGGHVAYVLWQLGRLEVPINRDRAVAGAAAVVAGLVLAVGAWLLERACRVKNDESSEG